MTNEKDKQLFFGLDLNNPMTGGILFFALGITLAIIFVITFGFRNKGTVNSFATCAQSKGSVIQESYPEVCVTADGKRFTNQNQKVVDTTPEPDSWKSYINTRYNYRVLYPKDWQIEEQYQVETRPSITLFVEEPLQDDSLINDTVAEIKIQTVYRSDDDQTLMEFVLDRAANTLLSLLDTQKTYLLAEEQELKAMAELTINGYDALMSDTVAYVDTGDYIYYLELSSPNTNPDEIEQSYKNIFKQVVLSFSPNESLSPTPIIDEEISSEEVCRDNQGTWIEEYSECEGLDKDVCEASGGSYDSCASACRNNPDAEVCIQLCVEVCSY